MRVPSLSSTGIRRAPQQDRATKRVSAFLDAAETAIAEMGFEAATMTLVAERAGSSIGSLYSYFPDKKALAFALLDKYSAQIKEHWQPLFDEVASCSGEIFAARIIDLFLDFLAEHPAYLQLIAAPIRLRRSASAKRTFRATLIHALQRRMPFLGNEKAALCAEVMVQIIRGMMQVYGDADTAARPAIVAEFKKALAAYATLLFAQS